MHNDVLVIEPRGKAVFPVVFSKFPRNHSTMSPKLKTILRNVLAVIAGIIVGSIVNMLLVNAGPAVIPLPEGADVSTMEGLKATIHLFEPRNFVFPFLAHALGTLVGALTGALLAANHKMKFALGISAFFLLGGIVGSMNLPAPTWFEILDIVVAYIPMGLLGGKLGSRKKS
jgi:hypothetical protein